MLLKKSAEVTFDPANADHREAVKRFMIRNSWADAGIKFAHNPAYGNLVNQVQTMLLEWYLEQEFKSYAQV